MKKGIALGTCLALLIGAAWGAEASNGHPYGKWSYQVQVEPGAAPAGDKKAVPTLILPPEVLALSQEGLGDLRVVDGTGQEIPYARGEQVAQFAPSWAGTPLNQGLLPDGKRTVTVARGQEDRWTHDKATLEVTGTHYLATVLVEGSDDGKTWTRLGNGVLLDEPKKIEDVSYNPSTYSYLRFTLDTKEGDLGVVQKVTIHGQPWGSSGPEPLGEGVAPTQGGEKSADGRALIWSWQKERAMPLRDVTFTTTAAAFERKVVVKASDDGASWRVAGTGLIYRHAGGENLRVTFHPQRAKHWQVWLYHENDQPLAGVEAMFHVPRRVIYLSPDQAQGQKALTVYFGNADAQEARYDLAALLSRSRDWEPVPVVWQGIVDLQGAVGEAPWTEENPWILRIALIAAVVLLGGLIARAYLHSRKKAQP